MATGLRGSCDVAKRAAESVLVGVLPAAAVEEAVWGVGGSPGGRDGVLEEEAGAGEPLGASSQATASSAEGGLVGRLD